MDERGAGRIENVLFLFNIEYWNTRVVVGWGAGMESHVESGDVIS